MSGKLIDMTRSADLRAPLDEWAARNISIQPGVEADARGRKPDRQVTVLFREGWDDACRELGASLPWITRRANLFVEGVGAPQQTGGKIRIGSVTLEIMLETDPCFLMEKAHAGLKAALTPQWRGGVCCKGIFWGRVSIGDTFSVT